MTLRSSDNHYITDISCEVLSLFLGLHCKYAPASLCQSQVHVFIINNTFISNARLNLTKNQANAKQHTKAELFPSENYQHSSSTLLSKNNKIYSK